MQAKSGKPKKRDAELTRQRLLKAALKEFAGKGLGGGRVDRIAERAGVNKRMLYHYFGSKEGLFLAVLEGAYGQLRSAERALDLEHLPPRAAIERIVDFTWDYYLKHPEFLTLVNSENLHKARHLKKSKILPAMYSDMLHLLQGILERGSGSGEFRAGVEPLQLAISIAALGYYYLTNRYTMTILADFDLMAPAALERRRAEIKRTVIASLRPD
ncbi:MAG: TetR/AcrR family transcriptional regulator [Gammaproteobacteria bacterium]